MIYDLIREYPEYVIIIILLLFLTLQKPITNISLFYLRRFLPGLGKEDKNTIDTSTGEIKGDKECYSESSPAFKSPMLKQQVVPEQFLDIFIDSIKVVFVIKEEAIIPVAQEAQFLGHLTKLIAINRDKIIVFDLTNTRIFNDAVISTFSQLVDVLLEDCVKLTIVLPNLEGDKGLSDKYARFYNTTVAKIEKVQNYNIKIKYDQYFNAILSVDELFLHKFFENTDILIYYKIPHLHVPESKLRNIIILFLTIQIFCLKYMHIGFLTAYKNKKFEFSFDSMRDMVYKTADFAAAKARQHGVPEEIISAFSSRNTKILDMYIESIDRTFKNEWYKNNEERINVILDTSLITFSQSFDDVFSVYNVIPIEKHNECSDVVINLKDLREEIAQDAAKRFGN